MAEPFTLDRFLAIPRLSGLRLAPDGARLIVSVALPGPDGKKFVTSLHELDPAGARPPRRLTRSAPGEGGGWFLPDGSILFTSTRPDPDDKGDDDQGDEEVARLWLLPVGGGEARVVASLPGGIDSVGVARESGTVLMAAAVDPRAAEPEEDRRRQKARKEADVGALLFESYPIRHWDHYLGPRERHLLVADRPDPDEGRLKPRDLTPGISHRLEEMDYDITPDGSVAVAGVRSADEMRELGGELVTIRTDSGEAATIASGDAWFEGARCSPDGRWVAAARSELGRPDRAVDQTLVLVDLEGGETRELTPDLDLWPKEPVWSADSSAVFFTADRSGHTAVFRVDVSGGEPLLLNGDGAYSDLCPSPDGETLYALRATMSSPPRPVALDGRRPSEPRVLPSPVPFDGDLGLPGVVERIETSTTDGTTIGSWLVRPADASRETPAPLLVFIHGGPLGTWAGWSWRWRPQLLVERGYAVLLPDPALSTGYGQAFIQRGWGRWGDAPFADIMAAVDAAVAREDIDAERTAAMGGSFGGYMANWVAGHTDRFRAIVTHASLWELRGFHGTTDGAPYWEREFGNPYRDGSRYDASSPHRFVDRIRTPLLVIHGEQDHRVPISEALRLWTDLMHHGADARFLYFPNENHWILKPNDIRVWYETVFAFLDQHLLGREWARPALL